MSKITGIKFINDNTFAAASLDGKIRIYDLVKNKFFRELSPPVNNQILSLDVEKEGELVFAGGQDPYSVYVWSYRTG